MKKGKESLSPCLFLSDFLLPDFIQVYYYTISTHTENQ